MGNLREASIAGEHQGGSEAHLADRKFLTTLRGFVPCRFLLCRLGTGIQNSNPIRVGGKMAKRKKKVTVTQAGRKAYAYLVKRGFWRAR